MNRSNIWIHLGLAAVLITFAAVLGRLDRLAASLSVATETASERSVKHDRVAPATSNAPARPEVLVRFKKGISPAAEAAIAGRMNDSVVDQIESVEGLTVIDDLDNASPADVARQYETLDEVAYAEPNYTIELDDPDDGRSLSDLVYRDAPAAGPNDPMFADQWALNNTGADGGVERADIDAINAWKSTHGSEDVVVAVLDSGMDLTHEDLKANLWTRPASLAAYSDAQLGAFDDLHGYNGVDKLRDPTDDNGHGTHCSGIIGAAGDNGVGIAGVNWRVKLMPLKFLGGGGMGSDQDAVEAINYAIERKKDGVNIRVISASWGSITYSRALEDAVRAAGDAGILFVAAAGNSGTNNDRFPHYPSNYDLPNVISVAAVDRSDQLASFSNYGPKTVDIAAPGKAILSTWLKSSYRESSGTSMAAPFVSGVAALVVAKHPNITLAELRQTLLTSVDPSDALKGKIASGGTLCAANALGLKD